MKRTLLIIAMFMMAVLPSCKRSMTDIKNPGDMDNIVEADKTLETQMQSIWEALNQSYVLWDIDTVNWDARRDKMIALGKKLDQLQKEGNLNFKEHQSEFDALFYGLLDHHLAILVVNPYKSDEDIVVNPGSLEIAKRPGYHANTDFKKDIDAIYSMNESGLFTLDSDKKATFKASDDCTYNLFSCVFNNGIAYIRMDGYVISEIIGDVKAVDAKDVVDSYFKNVKTMKENGTLKGIILDNRGNGGGYKNDLNYIIGSYLAEDFVAMKTRTKNGLGKYDYSTWVDQVISPYTSNKNWYVGDLGNIPYVALEDMHSLSMGEITGGCVSHLNSGIIIGERSAGGHGPLNPSLTYEQQGWCGTINYPPNSNHTLYNPRFCSRTWNAQTKQYEIQEGIGYTPGIEVKLDTAQLVAGYDNQLIRAIEYINTGK